MWNRRTLIALLVLVCVWPALSWGQQEMRSASKGSSTPLPITGSVVDADHNALDVKCLSGCSGGGGGSGDASEAEQEAQTAILTTIDADTGAISLGVGGTADAAATQGSTGSISAKLRTVTSQLNTLDGRVDGVEDGLGASADAAATAGSTGSLSAKLRLMTSQLDAIQTSIQTLDNMIESTRARVTLYDSAGAEIVIPTAGSTHYDAADASTNATNVKSAAGTVYHYSLSNTTSTLYYLRMYNLASAPTCSSATGFVESIPIPASTSGGGRERTMNIGQAFTTGIAYCITASSGSTANDNAAAGVFVSILYK